MSKNRVRHHVNPLSDRSEYTFAGFGNDKPIIVDIGADRGEFTQGLHEQYASTKNFMALEIRQPLVERLNEKFAPYENVAIFGGDAVRNLRSLLKSAIEKDHATIETIFINFPDPWFKDRHHKRRVICERLITDVQEWLPSGVTWVYQTDQKQLFDDTVALLKEHDVEKISYFDASPHGVQTKWEQAKMADGKDIYRMRFELV
jgi:tRNA (guanine-N7-)-methyltransferase